MNSTSPLPAPRPRKRWPAIVFAVLVLGAAGAAGGWYLASQSDDSSSGPESETVSVSGDTEATFLDDDTEATFLGEETDETGQPSTSAATIPSALHRHPELTFAVGFPDGWDVGWRSLSVFGVDGKVLDGYPDAAAHASGDTDLRFTEGGLAVVVTSGGSLTLPFVLDRAGQPSACTGTATAPVPFSGDRFSGMYVDYTGCGTAASGVLRRALIPTAGETAIYLTIRGSSSAHVQELLDLLLATATDAAPEAMAPPPHVACIRVPVSTEPEFPIVVAFSNDTGDAISYELVENGQVDMAFGSIPVPTSDMGWQTVRAGTAVRFTYASGAVIDYPVGQDLAQCVRLTEAGLVEG